MAKERNKSVWVGPGQCLSGATVVLDTNLELLVKGEKITPIFFTHCILKLP